MYAITPDEVSTARLLERVSQAIDGGARVVQHRNKTASEALRREQAVALLALCRARGVPLIVNDDWPLAVEIGADGAHLGRDDGDVARARAALGPDGILGVSCYDERDRAVAAADAGADYVAFGAFFSSPTKPNARRADPALLRQVAHLPVVRVAIGGITTDNAGALVDAGADLVAVISGVFDAPDPAATARAYSRAFVRNAPLR
ncbi:thiamine-phosphate synthase [Lysobacter bugurensis]|uniref:Thiamine-phosphate synthase n=1 Tax=Cognatilysobacter bugurensis TaxID=543356 RepID=A0A918T190_9GAMM|nr:thiamine-phosphate synthase [Lysobacter bugurensis]